MEHVSSPRATTSSLGIKRIDYYSAVETQHSSEDTEERRYRGAKGAEGLCLSLLVDVNTGIVVRGRDGRCEELDVVPTSSPTTKRTVDIAGATW